MTATITTAWLTFVAFFVVLNAGRLPVYVHTSIRWYGDMIRMAIALVRRVRGRG